MPHVLLCEDDVHLRNNISELLRAEGYSVSVSENAAGAERELRAHFPDLAVLDVLLPDGSGFDLCRRIRKSYPKLPVILLTCCASEEDVVFGFEAGADDYVEKPFSFRVLLSRMAALLRRSSDSSRRKEVGNMTLDLEEKTCRLSGTDVNLTPSEFVILWELARTPGEHVDRESLVHALWELDSPYVDENALCVHVSRLRSKLGPAAAALRTVRGEGYVLEVDRL